MADNNDRPSPKPTLLERLSAFLTREPEDREELLELLHGAFEHKLLDADALSMIEGVMSVSEMTVRDIMIPRSQMDVVSQDDAPPEFIPLVLETRHSRFPVVGENKDDVVGILHLQGFDHDTVRAARIMEARETAILAALGVPDPYASPVDARR